MKADLVSHQHSARKNTSRDCMPRSGKINVIEVASSMNLHKLYCMMIWGSVKFVKKQLTAQYKRVDGTKRFLDRSEEYPSFFFFFEWWQEASAGSNTTNRRARSKVLRRKYSSSPVYKQLKLQPPWKKLMLTLFCGTKELILKTFQTQRNCEKYSVLHKATRLTETNT